MFALTSSVRKTTVAAAKNHSRYLSFQGALAVEKLRDVLEDYRRVKYVMAPCSDVLFFPGGPLLTLALCLCTSYTRELPGRFKKDIVKAAQVPNTGNIAMDSLNRLLVNIGAKDAMTALEMRTIFQELGNASGEISGQRMAQIL